MSSERTYAGALRACYCRRVVCMGAREGIFLKSLMYRQNYCCPHPPRAFFNLPELATNTNQSYLYM